MKSVKTPKKKLAILRYHKSIPIEIDEKEFKEARMENMERE